MFKKWYLVPLAVAMCAWCALGKELTDIEALTSKQTRCSYEHAYDMYGAYCAGLRLTEIPSLKGGIEILDFSDNKLQEIHKDTLSSYTSIKFLYLSDNQIITIDEEAFAYLTGLQTLDLSNNVIMQVPANVMQLPSLRKLYLGGNPLIHMTIGHLGNKAITAPLELFDLSNCKLSVLPDWGLLPQLLLYNISNNPLLSLEPKHFAVMCNLKKLDLTKATGDIRLCRLKPAISWFSEKRIHFQMTSEEYDRLNSREFETCATTDVNAAHNETYNRCKSEYLQIESTRSYRRTWLTISGGLAGFLVGFILLLYLMHRHNVAQTRTQAEKMKNNKPKPDGDKHASAMLINNAS